MSGILCSPFLHSLTNLPEHLDVVREVLHLLGQLLPVIGLRIVLISKPQIVGPRACETTNLPVRLDVFQCFFVIECA